MTATYWPEYDFYFGFGVKALDKKLSARNIYVTDTDFHFVHLYSQTFISLLHSPDDILSRHKNVVIISSEHMMPIAAFWFKEYKNIIAVFSSFTSVNEVLYSLERGFRGARIIKSRQLSHSVLSNGDMEVLTLFFQGLRGVEIRKIHPSGNSTIYGRMDRISRKLGVRKLAYLLISEHKALLRS